MALIFKVLILHWRSQDVNPQMACHGVGVSEAKNEGWCRHGVEYSHIAPAGQG